MLKLEYPEIPDDLLERMVDKDSQPFLTLEQRRRRASGEDITAEIPPSRRAEFDEYKCRADERVRQAEEMYFKHNPELLETL